MWYISLSLSLPCISRSWKTKQILLVRRSFSFLYLDIRFGVTKFKFIVKNSSLKCWLVHLGLRETHSTLQFPVFFFFSLSFSAKVIQNIEEFKAKSYFTDHQRAKTIHRFRDSVLVLKIYDRYRIHKKLSNFLFLPKR